MAAESIESRLQKGKQALAQGKADQAKHLYLQALTVKSDSPDAHYGLATCYFMLNDLDSAAFHFKEVTRLDPLRPGAYVNLGAVLDQLGEYEEAVQVLKQGIKLDPQRAEGFYNIGLVFKKMGMIEQAAAAYVRALRITPDSADTHLNLANALMEMERFDHAANEYRRALELRPGWEQAELGLAAAEEGLAETAELDAPVGGAEGDQDYAPPTMRIPASEMAAYVPVPNLPFDPDTRVDPTTHGPRMEALFRALQESERKGQVFLQALETEIEPSIKELSLSLVSRRPGVQEYGVDERIRKFESAVEHIRNVHKTLQDSLQNVRIVGERVFKP